MSRYRDPIEPKSVRQDGQPPEIAWGYATPPYPGIEFEEEILEINAGTEHVLNELTGDRKIFVSYSQAVAFFIRQALTQGIKVTTRDVEDAYNIAFGEGCEYEWRYE